MTEQHVPTALTIAGSDSSGGAGIQADLKAFAALGVYGTSAITAVTAQNTRHVAAFETVTPDLLAQQIDAVLSDIGADAVKTGMLARAELVEVVATQMRAWRVDKLVIDPVIVASSGKPLLDRTGVERLAALLLPLAYVVTPNLPEAALLAGQPVASLADCRRAAPRLHDMGARNVVVTGGHLAGDEVVDLLFDGHQFLELRGPRLASTSTHGTGCTFSAAITANLALGKSLPDSVKSAKEYVAAAIRHARRIGHGNGPLNHFWS